MKKNLLFIIGLPIISLLFKFVFGPMTVGAHDGGFLAMFFGAIFGLTIFIHSSLQFKKWASLLIGVVLGVLIVFISSELNQFIFFVSGVEFWEIEYRQVWVNMFPKHQDSYININDLTYAIFFVLFVLFSIISVKTIEFFQKRS